MGITLYHASAYSGAQSDGYYTTLEKAKAAVEQLYLDIGGNTFKCKQMEWVPLFRVGHTGNEPDMWHWQHKQSGAHCTPDRFLEGMVIVRIENNVDSPMPVV